MKEGVKKSISLILVLTLLVQLLPVVAFGVGDETNDLDISTDSETVSMKDDDAEIVGEEDALREESVKHFRLRDGGYMLVEYETAVHYQTADGSWEEIDNTLQKTGQQYVAQAGDMTRKFAASLDSGFLFETAYQGQSVSMSLARRSSRDVVAVAPDVPAAEETAAPEETAVPETADQPQEAEQTEADQTQEPAEAAAETDVPQQETAEELPLLDDAAYTLVTSTAAARMENPGAKMRTFSKLAEKDKIQPQKIRSSVAFDNVMDGVSLLYQNYGYNVKESIIIEKPQEQYAYSFVLNLQGLTPTLEADGSVLLRGADGEPVYEIPAPYLADADGATSLEDAAYKLERISGGYLLTVEADPEWMNAPERAYPVTLDPTILLHNKGNVLTTFIRSAWPGSVAPNSADQFVGYRANEGYDACNIYVQFANLPEIPQNCVPISAQLAMYNAGFFTSDGVGCAAPDGSLTVEAHEWPAAVSDVSGLTWYLVHFGSTPVNEETIDYQKLSKKTLGEYVTWDITRTVMQWYQKQNEGDTSGGRGVLLEGLDGSENYRVANLIGSGYHDYSPYFAVYYRNPVGLESYYTYQEASAGKAGDLSIHNFTNQFTLDRADVSLSLEPASYALRHIYNSATSGIEFSNNEAGGIHTCDYTSMQVGVGWKLSAQQTVVECKVGDETYLVYNDEDGTEHYFSKTATNTYEDEDGLSLKIVKSTSGGNTIYTMTDMDKYHTWVFHNGYLISVTDNNSNTIYFAYNAAYSSGGSAWKPVKGSASNRLVQIVMDINSSSNDNPRTLQTVANLAYSGDRLSSVTDYAGRSTNYSYDSGGHLTQVTYADGTSASYEYYSSNGRLSTLYDAESQYGLDITYTYNLGVVSTFRVQEFANTSGAKQTGSAKTASEFFADSQRLKSYTTPSGAKHTLGYDASNNLQEDTLAGLTNYTYHNDSGSPTTSMTREGYSGDYLKSQNVYDSTGRFRTLAIDANGVQTGYTYDGTTLQLTSVHGSGGATQTYTYQSGRDRVSQTAIDQTAALTYRYDRAQLTDLIRKAFPQAADADGQNVNPFWQHYLLGYDAFGNMTRVQVCASSAEREGHTAPVTLASYTYEGNVNNGRLATMTYGNGDSVSYTYDAFDRQRTAAYNDGTTYHYDYSGDNDLARQYVTDGSGAVTEQYSYQYDSLGRLIHSRQSTGGGTLVQLTQHMYDNANRLTSQSWQFGGDTFRQSYTYTGQNSDGKQVDGTISAITTTIPDRSAITSEYKYNDLRQLKSKSVTGPDQNGTQTKVYDRTYTYAVIAEDDGCNRMGTRLASTGYTFGSSSRGFTYTYDAAGNISRVVTAGTSVPKAAASKEYGYDAQGQLVSEKNSSGTTFGYAYDTAGNIRSITKNGTVTKSFGYTNPSWPDLLTSVTANGTTKDVLYEGQSQTSDLPSSGNPVTYYNGKDYTFTWTKGRQLASATVDGKQVSYTYDMSGVRSGKQVYTTSNQRTTTYTYTTLSGKVMRQQWETRNSDDTVYQAMQSLEFVYDDGNQPFAMIYKHGQTTELYYYVLNAQGDVIALLNANGTLAASYNYGAWGNYSVHGADGKKTTDPTFIGHINPLRYRGYYYDRETRLYYLQSRYYDFANYRFINADGQFTDGFIGSNLFAYCENNPIRYSDPTGLLAAEAAITLTNWWNPIGWITAAVVVVEVVAIVAISYGIAKNVSLANRNTGGNSADTSSPENYGGSTPASPQPPKNNGRGNNKKSNNKPSLKKLTNFQLKSNGLDAHALKKEYLGKKAEIKLYDLAYDSRSRIIFIIDKAGRIIYETAYKIN